MLYKLLSIGITIATTQAEAVVRHFTTKLDHFSLGEESTFRIRYLIDDQYWKSSEGDETKPRPILFYCGNEGDI